MKSVFALNLIIASLITGSSAFGADDQPSDSKSFLDLRQQYQSSQEQNIEEIKELINYKDKKSSTDRRVFECHAEISPDMSYLTGFNPLKGRSFNKQKHLATNAFTIHAPFEIVVKNADDKVVSLSLYQDEGKTWNKVDFIRVKKDDTGQPIALIIETAVTHSLKKTPNYKSIEDDNYEVYGYTTCDLATSVAVYY